MEIREQVATVWERGDPDRLVGVKDLDCDVAVFQRVFHRTSKPNPNGVTDGVSLELLRAVQAQGVAVVVDLDDDLGAIDPRHGGYAALEGCEPIVKEACRIADLVTVSTPALAKRYGGVVIPNGIPRAYLGITADRHDPPMIGWTGSPLTHVGDLAEVGTTIRDLCASGKATFRAMGNAADLTLHQLGIPDQEKIPGADLVSLDYARAYAELDIAIVPLRWSRFNAGKSWLKMLEAAALGVPVVGSPSPENARLGAGMIAESLKDWRVCLTKLCESSDLRLSLAAAGRAAASGWTIEGRIAPMLADVWAAVRSGTVQAVTA